MTIDLLRTQVKDLLDCWTDRDDHERDSLLRMLAEHLEPVRLADSDQSVKAKITAGPAPWDDAVAHLLADISSGTRTIERGLDIACGFQPRTRGGSDGNTRHALGRIPDLVDAIINRDTDGELHEITAEARVTVGTWHRAALLLLGAERRWAHIRGYRALGMRCDRCDGAGELTVSSVTGPGDTEPQDQVVACWYCDGTGDQLEPAVAVCPYCSSPVRIQPDLADEGDTTRHLPDRAATSYGQKASASCVNPGCADDNGNRHSWPVDPWLGHLLTWRRDNAKQRAS